ncbi:LOW QUALITY PROTEIN: coiled-coil domain-containing protein 166 [Chelonia mydas]|uniref:LOW QUALITY PROTEIN: coiled-coil domain-containing protein 166 n=1 Tax=Chelonia mydas TaxID=8469 RepID=UPI000FFBB680|nr:LOW QUALITY PROTEIN: coiled-coil domain-containing protein 166 [Chelonia mydas]
MASKKEKPEQKAEDFEKSKQGANRKEDDISKARSSTEPFVKEREQYLEKEYKILTEHVHMYMKRVEHFLWENEFLDKEAQKIREDSKAYMTYISKHTQKHQNAIITLNNQNHFDLAQVRKQKEELISQYTAKEKEVRNQLMEMETKYSLMNKEVEDLQPFKDLQLEQLSRIKELEKELLVTKIQHSEQMHKVKSRFLQVKAKYELDSHQKVQSLAKRAEEEAVRSLIQHTKQVKAENWRLRHELLSLIRRSHILKTFKLQLREQQQQLLREHHYSQDLTRMRHWLIKQHRAQGSNNEVNSFGSSLKSITSAKIRHIPTSLTSAKS